MSTENKGSVDNALKLFSNLFNRMINNTNDTIEQLRKTKNFKISDEEFNKIKNNIKK